MNAAKKAPNEGPSEKQHEAPGFDGPAVLRSAIAVALVAGVVFGGMRAARLFSSTDSQEFGSIPVEWTDDFSRRYLAELERDWPAEETEALALALARHQHDMSVHFVPILGAVPPGGVDATGIEQEALYSIYAELQTQGVLGHLESLSPPIATPVDRDDVLGEWRTVDRGGDEMHLSLSTDGRYVRRRGTTEIDSGSWGFALDRLTMESEMQTEEADRSRELRLQGSSRELLVWIVETSSQGPLIDADLDASALIVWERSGPPSE